jgi:arsenate reductase (thioredoxin)
VTMGCGDVCPFFPGKQYVDWSLPDPVAMSPDEVRALRDDIRRRVADLAG